MTMVRDSKKKGNRPSDLLDSAPPHNLEAERGLLSAVLVQPSIIDEVINAGISRRHFHAPDHAALYERYLELAENGHAIEPVALRSLSTADGDDKATALMGELVRGGGLAANWPYYCDQLKECAAKRQLRHAGEQLLIASANGVAPSAAAADAVRDLGQLADADGKPTDAITPMPLGTLAAENPTLAEPIIGDLQRRTETSNIVSASKVGKSWLVNHLALCAAMGLLWLGTFLCRRGRVLLIDNELHPATLAFRLRTVAEAMFLQPSDYEGKIDIISLRGKNCDLHHVIRLLDSIKPGTYELIIFDAWYRGIPPGVSENDNAQIMALYNAIDGAAARLQCAWVNIHHSSKGSQGEKAVTDVGSGAGAQSRAADAHIILRPHEEPDCVVLEAAVRSFPPVKPLGLKWVFPLWEPADDLDTSRLKGRLNNQEKKQNDRDKEGCEKIMVALAKGPATPRAIRGATGLSKDRTERLLDYLESKKQVEWTETTIRGNPSREYKKATNNHVVDE